jgi:hypothetical protein
MCASLSTSSRIRTTCSPVDGEFVVPAGGQLKGPSSLMLSGLELGSSFAEASFLRYESPSVTTVWLWCSSRLRRLTAVSSSVVRRVTAIGRNRPHDSNGQGDPRPSGAAFVGGGEEPEKQPGAGGVQGRSRARQPGSGRCATEHPFGSGRCDDNAAGLLSRPDYNRCRQFTTATCYELRVPEARIFAVPVLSGGLKADPGRLLPRIPILAVKVGRLVQRVVHGNPSPGHRRRRRT